jgi:hypothetical protein
VLGAGEGLGAGETVAVTASSAVCGGRGGSGEEDSVLGAGEATVFVASSAVCGGEGGSGEDEGSGAVDGDEWGSEPGVEGNDQGYRGALMEVTVGS